MFELEYWMAKDQYTKERNSFEKEIERWFKEEQLMDKYDLKMSELWWKRENTEEDRDIKYERSVDTMEQKREYQVEDRDLKYSDKDYRKNKDLETKVMLMNLTSDLKVKAAAKIKELDQQYKTDKIQAFKTNEWVSFVNMDNMSIVGRLSEDSWSFSAGAAGSTAKQQWNYEVTGQYMTKTLPGNKRPITLDKVAIEPFEEAYNEIKSLWQSFLVADSFRDVATQTNVLKQNADKYGVPFDPNNLKGVSDALRKKWVDVATPGTSLHQKGIAIDVYWDNKLWPPSKEQVAIMNKHWFFQNPSLKEKGHFEYRGNAGAFNSGATPSTTKPVTSTTTSTVKKASGSDYDNFVSWKIKATDIYSGKYWDPMEFEDRMVKEHVSTVSSTDDIGDMKQRISFVAKKLDMWNPLDYAAQVAPDLAAKIWAKKTAELFLSSKWFGWSVANVKASISELKDVLKLSDDDWIDLIENSGIEWTKWGTRAWWTMWSKAKNLYKEALKD